MFDWVKSIFVKPAPPPAPLEGPFCFSCKGVDDLHRPVLHFNSPGVAIPPRAFLGVRACGVCVPSVKPQALLTAELVTEVQKQYTLRNLGKMHPENVTCSWLKD